MTVASPGGSPTSSGPDLAGSSRSLPARSALDRLDETGDTSVVAPRTGEVARTPPEPLSTVVVIREARDGSGLSFHVSRVNHLAVLTRNEQVGCGADGIREHERQAAGGGFVDHDSTRLAAREQQEDVGRRVQLDE